MNDTWPVKIKSTSSRFFDQQRNLQVMNTTLSANQRWFFFRILPEVSDPFSLGLTKRIVASGNEIENMDVQYQVKNRLSMPWTSKLVSVTFYIRLHGKVDRLFCHSQIFQIYTWPNFITYGALLPALPLKSMCLVGKIHLFRSKLGHSPDLA